MVLDQIKSIPEKKSIIKYINALIFTFQSILVNYQYDPNIHMMYDETGLLVPTETCSIKIMDDIYQYFQKKMKMKVFQKIKYLLD